MSLSSSSCEKMKIHFFIMVSPSSNLPICVSSTTPCDSDLSCASDGYFPDPLDCRVFHLCMDLTPSKYSCDPGTPSYNFDVVLHRCTPTARCGYECSDRNGVRVPHPDDRKLFAYCVNGTVAQQDRCPGNYELNEVTQKCEAVCYTNGVLVDIEDCTKYYRCVYQNYGYYKSREQCSGGMWFNPLSLQCEQTSIHCSSSEQSQN